MFYRVFRIRTSPWIDFTTQIYENRWNVTVITLCLNSKILRIWNKNERGWYKPPNYDHFRLNLFLIDRTPTGLVHMSTLDRHIELHGQPSDLTLSTGVSTLTSRVFTHEIMKIWKINLDLMFWFDVGEQVKNDHFCIFLLHTWNLKGSVHEKIVFTQICIRITVGVSKIVVDPGCTHFNDKIDIRIRWEFFSQHRTLSLIEYLDNFI